METQKINWTTLEYEHRRKAPDWFWALSILAVSGAVTAIIYKNYLFALFIILAAFTIGFLSLREPKEIEVEISEKGVKVDDILYPFKTIKSFFVIDNKLLLHTDRLVAPIMMIYIKDFPSDWVKEFLKKHLQEKEMREPISHILTELLGF